MSRNSRLKPREKVSRKITIKIMLSVERVKELINDPKLSDKEVEEIRDQLYMLSEIMFEQWQAERIKAKKAEQKDNEKKEEPKI